MTVRCAECGGTTIWDDDAGSAICTFCGTLTDPSQSILASHLEQPDNSTNFNAIWDPAAATTLKSLRRTGENWDLAGQGKEARDRKNNFAISEFIKSLAVSMNAPGLSPRAATLFNQAKAASHFRWGRKAKLVAGACLSIALRESKRPDSLRDIAFLLNEALPTLTQTFNSITSLLKLRLVAVDPSVYISTLQMHFTAALGEQSQEFGLSASLEKLLKPLCLRSVAATANSLSDFVVRLGPDCALGQLPVPPTACAIFMLALESENRGTLNNLGELAQCLGARCRVGKGVVMSRYKLIQDEIASSVEKVPWLDKYESKKGRAKVAKRTIVARGLKDVLRFQEELWRGTILPEVTLDSDDESSTPSSRSMTPSVSERDSLDSDCPRKRRKVHNSIQNATRFLLNPLSGSIPSCTMFMYPQSTLRGESSSTVDDNAPLTSQQLPFTSYVLTAPSTALSSRRPPTRLQVLAVDRGGAGSEEIGDDELFDEGELDGFIRSEEEVQSMRQILGWPMEEDIRAEEEGISSSRPRKARGKRKAADRVEEPKRSRVNLDALAHFLGDTNKVDNDQSQLLGLEAFTDGKEDDLYGYDYDPEALDSFDEEEDDKSPTSTTRIRKDDPKPVDTEEVVIDNWRPMSPEHVFVSYDADDRYDEEYD
ncbi:hypothetical protein BDQ12DRAFT_719804 [Crucibulum laeve]|uniref:TFIIB-type domain-containing protein n=1 Tax=Crucibulum laeve TaxID=68775 RepID=A0A5C3MBY8_9AGAR|nr:hypothetical protein BDQ12DRAFT_719804 [Crucibulum laeve]